MDNFSRSTELISELGLSKFQAYDNKNKVRNSHKQDRIAEI